MKHKQPIITRLLCLLLAAVMTAGILTACGEPSNDKATKDSAADTGEKTETAVSDLALATNIEYINIPGEDAEIAQEIKLSADGVEIDGAVAADDVALKGSFEGMKVAKIANDKNAVTLTIAGSPSFDINKINTGNYGTIELAGKYFGEEYPVAKKIMVTQLSDDAPVEGGFFYPSFESAVEKDGAYELTITLNSRASEFTDGFGKDKITLENDFEDAKLISLNKKENAAKSTSDEAQNDEGNSAYEMVLNVPAKKDAEGSYYYIGKITLDKGSLIDRNGKENAEPVSASRSYSTESLGRDLSPKDVTTIKNIVGGFGNTTFGTITSVLSGIGTVGSIGYQVLGWFGVFPTDASRHAEVMKKLEDISTQINLLNDKLNDIDNTLQKQTDMLYEIEKTQKETILESFGQKMVMMTTAMSDIEYALSDKNIKKINSILENYSDIEFDNEDEMYDALDAIAVKIGKLRASNTDYISDKIKIVEENYRAIAASVVNTPSNPINRYVELCSLTDNFSTTSLTEKRLYAINIEANLKKAVAMLNFFKGFRANQNNRDLFEALYIPDVTTGVTDADGHAKCYLMDCYIKLSGDVTDYFRTPKNYITEKVDTNTNNNNRKMVILCNADAKRFGSRLHGRTLKEELIKAGVKEEEMTITTSFDGVKTTAADNKGELSRWSPDNRQYVGICFEYLYLDHPTANKKHKPSGATDWIYYPESLEAIAPYPSLDNWSPFARERDIEFAVIGQTILWEDTEFADQWSVLSLLDNAASRASKDGSGYCSAYPAMHLVPA